MTGAVWHRSSRCETAQCVEVADGSGVVLVRDSKLDESPVLAFDRKAWAAFLGDVKAGRLG